MKKSKILAAALSTALVASVAATASISVSAATLEDLPKHKIGVVGGFNDWKDDIAMTDDDGDGVYEAIVDIKEVKKEWITEWSQDDKPQGKNYLQFKVRLDGAWDASWGMYEPEHVRTQNSQSNVYVKEAKEGEPIKFKVLFDTKHNDPAAVAAGYEDLDFEFLYVTYEIVKDEAPAEESKEEAPVEESKEEAPVEESKEEAPAEDTTEESPADTTGDADETTPATGDTTSAIALVAVVLASLGTAVVMTKKASAKD